MIDQPYHERNQVFFVLTSEKSTHSSHWIKWWSNLIPGRKELLRTLVPNSILPMGTSVLYLGTSALLMPIRQAREGR